MPATGAGTFSTRNNSQDSTANGAAAVSLRGMGPDATLVLINGRRVAISAFAESITNSFVDINSIPVSAIERIDILKDGASAIYGSDAVAGVVNVVLKKDYEGLEINAGYGGTTGPSYDETVFYGALKAKKAVLQLSSTISTTARLALTRWVVTVQPTNLLMAVWTSVRHEVTQATST